MDQVDGKALAKAVGHILQGRKPAAVKLLTAALTTALSGSPVAGVFAAELTEAFAQALFRNGTARLNAELKKTEAYEELARVVRADLERGICAYGAKEVGSMVAIINAHFSELNDRANEQFLQAFRDRGRIEDCLKELLRKIEDRLEMRKEEYTLGQAPFLEDEVDQLVPTESYLQARDHFEALLRGRTPQALNVWGKEGVGKTPLLAEMATDAKRVGHLVVSMEPRHLSEDPRDSFPVLALLHVAKCLEKMCVRLERFQQEKQRYRDALSKFQAHAGDYEGLKAMVERPGALAWNSSTTKTLSKVTNESPALGRVLHDPVSVLSAALLMDVSADGRRMLLLVDDYNELPGSVRWWLVDWLTREEVPASMAAVVASRHRLVDAPFGSDQATIELSEFSLDDAREFIEHRVRSTQEQEMLLEVLDSPPYNPKLLSLLLKRGDTVDHARELRSYLGQLRVKRSLPDHLLELDLANNGCSAGGQREIARRLAVARQLDKQVVRVVERGTADQAGTTLAWLERLPFMQKRFTQHPARRYFEAARRAFLKTQEVGRVDVHRELAASYEERLAVMSAPKSRSALRLEYVYHTLSARADVDSADQMLANSLSKYLEALPEAFPLTWRYSAMFRQIVAENHDCQSVRHLSELADELEASHQRGRSRMLDPAEHTFSLAAMRVPFSSIPQEEARAWLYYFRARRLGDISALKHLCDRGHKKLTPLAALDLCELLARLGNVSEAAHWGKVAEEHTADPFQRALARLQKGTNYKRASDFRPARDALHEAWRDFKKICADSNPVDRVRESAEYYQGRAVYELGNVHAFLGRTDEATRYFENAIELLSGISFVATAEALHRLGWVHRIAGRSEPALRCHEQAEHRLRAASAHISLGKVLHSKGNLLSSRGQNPEALAAYDEALALLPAGMNRHRALALADAAEVQFALGRIRQAGEGLRQAIAWHEEHPQDQRDCLNLARALAAKVLLSLRLGARKQAFDAQHRAELNAHASKSPDLIAHVDTVGALLALFEKSEGRTMPSSQAPLEHLRQSVSGSRASVGAPEKFLRYIRILEAAERILAEGVTETEKWVDLRSRLVEAAGVAMDVSMDVELRHFVRLAVDALGMQGRSGSSTESLDFYDYSAEESSPEVEDIVGTVSHWQAHAWGICHGAVHVWITVDGKRSVLFQQRGRIANDFPGCLDISAAGHVRAGESWDDAATRELHEELAVDPVSSAPHLRPLCSRRVEEARSDGRMNREYQRIYQLEGTDLERYTPRYPEVEGIFVLPIAETLAVLRGESSEVDGHGKQACSKEAVEAVTRRFNRSNFIESATEYLIDTLTRLSGTA